ncbi:MAG: DUF4276 family protein [Phycisphaerales bacterium]|nr:DUF4276 family protein [Phycisphaerales bacterium]
MATEFLAILAEGSADAEVLAQLVRRHYDRPRLPIHAVGCEGQGNLLNSGVRRIGVLSARGIRRFVICLDADGPDPNPMRDRAQTKILRPSSVDPELAFIAVPVQAIEAWLIADELAITQVIPSLTIPQQQSPERIDRPKEWLIGQSRSARSHAAGPLFAPQVHNPRVAEHVRLEVVERKCPSFREFRQWLSRHAPASE